MSNNFLSRYSPWIVLTVAVYSSVFVYLFIENFIFSSSLDLTSVREFDDYAFQISLRHYHENRKFFALHDYAYGWIFWFPLVCLTYPFYFLSVYYGIDMPLVVIPRQLSLVFTMGTAFFLYKIASLYTKDNFIKAVILLLYLSFPATGYFALRFGTVAQTMFLSSIAYYIAAKKEFLTQKDLYNIAVAVGAAVATKLSALLITPLIALVILDRLSWKISRENIVYLGKSFFVFLFALAALSQMRPKVVIAQIKTIQSSYGDQGIYDSFLNGIVSPNLHISIFLLMLLFLGSKAIIALKKDRNFYKRDFLYIFLALLISITYLLSTVKMGAAYITIYFTVISCLLPLGIIILEHINIYLRYIAGALFLALSILLNFNSIISTQLYSRAWNSYYIQAVDPSIVRYLSVREVLKTKLKKPEDYTDKLKILKDYKVPTPYSIFSKNTLEINVFNNITVIAKKYKYDLIGLDKRGVAFLTDSEFNNLIQNIDPKVALQYADHRKAINNILLKKQFNNVPYEVLLEDEEYVYYVPNSLINH